MRHYPSSLGCNRTKLAQAMKENHVVSNSPINSAHIASFMSSNSKIEKVDFGHPQSRFIPVCGGALSTAFKKQCEPSWGNPLPWRFSKYAFATNDTTSVSSVGGRYFGMRRWRKSRRAFSWDAPGGAELPTFKLAAVTVGAGAYRRCTGSRDRVAVGEACSP